MGDRVSHATAARRVGVAKWTGLEVRTSQNNHYEETGVVIQMQCYSVRSTRELVPRRIADQRHGIRSVRPLMAGSEAIVRWSLTRNSLFNDERGLCSSGLLDQSNRSQIVRAGIRWRVNEVWYSECCACGHGEDRCGRCTEYQDDTQRTIPGRADVWISEHASEQEQAVNAYCSRQ